jgi:hypothetical protein
MLADELIGIDFSGDARQWRRISNRPNVWIATGRASGGELHVTGLCAVQQLSGTKEPFDRLREFLANAPSSWAAIDAPFSVQTKQKLSGSKFCIFRSMAGHSPVGRHW